MLDAVITAAVVLAAGVFLAVRIVRSVRASAGPGCRACEKCPVQDPLAPQASGEPVRLNVADADCGPGFPVTRGADIQAD